MNIARIREDFPILQKQIKGRGIVYFDSACMSLRPESVIQAVDGYYRELSACAGRSAHFLARATTEKVSEARAAVAKFVGAARPDEIIFCRNTTEAINLVAHSLDLKPGDAVVLSDKEHNSNLIPWLWLAKKIGIKIRIIPSKDDNSFDLEYFKTALARGAKLVSLASTSNLDGTSIPIQEVIGLAHAAGALVLLDAAQTVPHRRLNVRELGADFLAFSGHKILGPSGTGVLYGKLELLERLEPFILGGSTVSGSTYDNFTLLPPPEKFEAGLQDYAGIIGLGAAVKYLEKLDFDAIAAHELELNHFISKAISSYPQVSIIGPAEPEKRGSIISFTCQGLDHHQIAVTLNEMSNIMIRSGQHCVHSWFAARKIPGSARASLYFYNTMEEAELFAASFDKIMKLI